MFSLHSISEEPFASLIRFVIVIEDGVRDWRIVTAVSARPNMDSVQVGGYKDYVQFAVDSIVAAFDVNDLEVNVTSEQILAMASSKSAEIQAALAKNTANLIVESVTVSIESPDFFVHMIKNDAVVQIEQAKPLVSIADQAAVTSLPADQAQVTDSPDSVTTRFEST